MRWPVTSAAGGRGALAVAVVLVVSGLAGCGGQDATTASAPAPAPRCRAVPRPTLRLIASHANPRTRFAAGSAAAVRAGSGYAVSVVALAGGTRHMGTWFVDDLRAPSTVTSANVQALEITNWPLEALAPLPARRSGLCAARTLRAPLAP